MLFIALSLPLAGLLLRLLGIGGLGLGANPIEALMDTLGLWGLRILLLTLCISPLASLVHKPWVMGLRRMVGLFSFTYLALHFLVWLVLDKWFDWRAILEDIAERPFITIGATALLMLLPLAVTSTKGWMRRLGRRWQQLHRLVYPAAVLGVWHFWGQVKADWREPLIYALTLALLLGWRVRRARARR
ncbi:MAG TPA: protein-methionine-sulfoxide reductase heme-binding subunit MsrQ [Steroidobacteraceae bacterium]|nr:protein-methionine-sulfoxide reductase heme-binding subunit MsrQ [Steroidobacteraceae bacterium]